MNGYGSNRIGESSGQDTFQTIQKTTNSVM